MKWSVDGACLVLLVASPMAQTPLGTSSPETSVTQQKQATPVRIAPTGMSITVTADTPCVLTVDGEQRMALLVDTAVTLTLARAVHTLRAVSSEDPEDRWEQTLDLTKKEETLEVRVALVPVRRERLEAIEASEIVAVLGGVRLPLKRLASLQIEAGDFADGVTIIGNVSGFTYVGATVLSPGTVYARNPLGTSRASGTGTPSVRFPWNPDDWLPVESFTIVEVQTARPHSVVIRSGARSFPAAFVVKMFPQARVMVLVPPALIPCTLEFNR